MVLDRSTSTHVLTTVKIESVFAYVRTRRGPFAVARLVAAANLRSTDPTKLGTESWDRILAKLPQVLDGAELAQLREIVDLGTPDP